LKTSNKKEETPDGTPKVEGKKFSKAVTTKKRSYWDQGLEFDGSTLEIKAQKALLKDWLLSDRSFEEVCQMHGLNEEEARSLKEKLPQNLIALKEMQVSESFSLSGRSTDDDLNRQAILILVSDGLRLSRQVRVMADLEFMSGMLTPANLGRMVGSWDKILHRIGTFLTTPELDEEEGFRALMQLTREELGDLKDKIAEYRRYKLEIPEAEVILKDGDETK